MRRTYRVANEVNDTETASMVRAPRSMPGTYRHVEERPMTLGIQPTVLACSGGLRWRKLQASARARAEGGIDTFALDLVLSYRF